MKRIHFYISNSNHHWQMFKPVMKELRNIENIELMLVSLCEFRRMTTPIDELEKLNIPYFLLRGLKFKGSSTSTGKKHIGGNQSIIRNILREVIWSFWLLPSLLKSNKQKPDLVVIPNDVAYPFNKICSWFKKKNIPFILFQEGIRFPLPNEEGQTEYGRNHSRYIFAWGEKSGEYFKNLSIGNTQIFLGGNPRFDGMIKCDYSTEVLRIRENKLYGNKNILYVSNPVDDQGFCTHEEKMELFRKFIQKVRMLREEIDLVAWVRLHPREDAKDFENEIEKEGAGGFLGFLPNFSLFGSLRAMDGAIILASTVGLEAMMNNVPVAVIKLPRHDYVFDYVSSGAALPLDLDRDSCETIKRLISDSHEIKAKRKSYLEQHVTNLGESKHIISSKLVEIINAKG